MRHYILLAIVAVLCLAGCATTARGRVDINQIQQLQMRVSELEQELQEKDREILALESEVERAKTARHYSAKKTTAKSALKKDAFKIAPKQIQIALKNAGFYNGPIDGNIGKNTKRAVIAFQRAKGLKPDGIIGKQTKVQLKKYL